MPVILKYDGVGDPVAHCQNVKDLVKFVSKHAFPRTLERRGMTRNDKLLVGSIYNFHQLAELFIQAFQHEIPADRDFCHLLRLRQRDDETLREFFGSPSYERSDQDDILRNLTMANALVIQEDERQFKSGRGDVRDRIDTVPFPNESNKRKVNDPLDSYETNRKQKVHLPTPSSAPLPLR
ncbi:hypothetical protein LIER_44007 [Lithospermum erythrorhizon]|uniref:Uncharacterized protein n=1 Tax=Lithospermum erythrorhizon TaxID=34254 RepID=A0AAV3RI35_LITER